MELSGRHPRPTGNLVNVLTRHGRFEEAEAIVAAGLANKTYGRFFYFEALIKNHWRGDLAAAAAGLGRWPDWLRREDRGAVQAWNIRLWSRQPEQALAAIGDIKRDYLRDTYFTGPRAVLTARAHEVAGHHEAAQADWRQVIQLADRELAGTPEDRNALYWKAWALARLGDLPPAQAIATLMRQRGLFGTAPETGSIYTAPAFWVTLGQLDLAVASLTAPRAPEDDRLPITRAQLEHDPAFEPLKKDPRYQQLLEAAPGPARQRAESGGQRADQRSIAVLAFANLSDDKDNEYFSDGISEELLTVLQKIPGLRVAARTSAFSFKGKDATTQEIGQKLGVAHLVEGSVRRAGGSVRISARLSRADNGEQVWSESYTRELKDVFAVQSELAQTIVEQLGNRLGGSAAKAEIQAQVQAAIKGGTRNPEAHQLYLQGKFFANQFSMANLARAAALFQQAIDRDANFALAWAALGRVSAIQAEYDTTGAAVASGFARARTAADRALALEPNLAEGYSARLEVQVGYDFDWRGARESARRALELAPADALVVHNTARLAGFFGDLEKSVELGRQAVALDPVNAEIRGYYAGNLALLRRYAEAEIEHRRALELSPSIPLGHSSIAMEWLRQGRAAEALAEAEKELTDWSRATSLAIIHWALKNTPAADAELARLVASYADVCAYQIAQVHAYRRENDRAFAWLERAYRQRDPGLAFSKKDVELSNLHADPRWLVFQRKLGLTDEQLK